MKRTIATVATTLGLAISVSACSIGRDTPHSKQSTSPSQLPSTLGPPNAKIGFAGLVSALPDTCQAVKSSLPTGMSAGHLWNSFMAGPSGNQDFQECEWSVLDNTHARFLSYGFFRYASLGDTRKEMAHRRQRTHFDDDQCRYNKALARDIEGLGEAAFTVPCEIEKNTPSPAVGLADHHEYQVGGAEIDVQIRNVIIQVWWVGADYPAPIAQKNPRWLNGGSELSHKVALPQATTVAKAILTHFPQ